MPHLAIAKLLKWSLMWYFDVISLDIMKIHVTQNESDDYDDKNNLENDDDVVNAYCNQVNLSNDYYYLNDDNEFIDSLNVINNSYEQQQPPPQNNALLFSDDNKSKKSSLKPSERNIRLFIRWTLEGTPRPSYMASLLFSQSVQIPRSTFSGVFMYRFDNKDGLISEHHVKYIVPAPSRRAVLYHGFGGLSGLIWRIRSGMRQQKNEWGMGLGIFATKLKKS